MKTEEHYCSQYLLSGQKIIIIIINFQSTGYQGM